MGGYGKGKGGGGHGGGFVNYTIPISNMLSPAPPAPHAPGRAGSGTRWIHDTLAVHTGQQPTGGVPDFWGNCRGGARLMWQFDDGVKWDMVEPHWNQRLTNMWFDKECTGDCRSMAELLHDGLFETYEGHGGTRHQWDVWLESSESDGDPNVWLRNEHMRTGIPTGVATPRGRNGSLAFITDEVWHSIHLRMVTVFRTATSYEGAEAVDLSHIEEPEMQWQYGSRTSWQMFEPSAVDILNRALEEGLPLISWLHEPMRHGQHHVAGGTDDFTHNFRPRYTANFTDYTLTSGNGYVRPIRLVAIKPGDHRRQARGRPGADAPCQALQSP
jgi:hypothetical protein